VVAIVAIVFVIWLLRSGGERTTMDLIAEFPTATIKRPRPEVFSIVDASLAGVSHQAIFASEPSRIAWHFMVPTDAWLKLSIGMKEQGWTVPGDGVIFQIGVSNGKTYEELLRLHVDPYNVPADRQWKDITLDLSPYSGEAVDLIFNNLSSPDPPPGQPPKDDRNGDMPLWGIPRIVVR
jgi:hypothetical protein